MNIYNEFISFTYTIYLSLQFIFYYLKQKYFLENNIKTIKEPLLSEEQNWILPIKTKFLESINRENLSDNIDDIFYDKSKFLSIMQNSENELEKIWKTRVLMVMSPHGNIIIYYDPYKLGFAYYSDQNVISYDILNTIAMKYVLTYNCLNFFIDEVVLPNYNNPLKILHTDTIANSVTSNGNMNNSFMKKTKTNHQSDQLLLRNKFIYLGNIRNFNICSKPKKVYSILISPLLEGLDNTISWKNFKNNKL
jgi:hypothetical protein